VCKKKKKTTSTLNYNTANGHCRLYTYMYNTCVITRRMLYLFHRTRRLLGLTLSHSHRWSSRLLVATRETRAGTPCPTCSATTVSHNSRPEGPQPYRSPYNTAAHTWPASRLATFTAGQTGRRTSYFPVRKRNDDNDKIRAGIFVQYHFFF